MSALTEEAIEAFRKVLLAEALLVRRNNDLKAALAMVPGVDLVRYHEVTAELQKQADGTYIGDVN